MSGKKVKIGDIFNIQKGTLQSSKCISGNYKFITAAEEWKTHNTYTHDCEALIFAAAASGSLGRTHYIKDKFTSSDLCFILTQKDETKYPLDLKLYHFVLNSLKEDIVKSLKTGTSKEAINYTNFFNYELYYFDIEKQKLWIDKLLNVKEIKDKILVELYQQQTYLQSFRQTILKKAVQGKLTNQDPKDEPASELLKRIKAEKEKLIKVGKLKKEKELPQITDSEIPFEVPEGWVWCRLGEVALSSEAGKSFQCSERAIQNNEWGIIKMSAISSGIYKESENKYFTDVFKDDHFHKIQEGDLLFARASGSKGLTGICCIAKSVKANLLLNDKTIRFRFSKNISVDYINYWNNCLFGRSYYDMIMGSKTTTMNNITREQFNNLVIPLPPFLDQRRIVAKVQQLQDHLTQLETQVQQSRQYAHQLLQSVLKEAFEPNQKQFEFEGTPSALLAEN